MPPPGNDDALVV